jgi:hypothetical protein
MCIMLIMILVVLLMSLMVFMLLSLYGHPKLSLTLVTLKLVHKNW